MAKRKSTLRSALVVASGTLVSRVLGLGRDIAIAFFFGLGAMMDAYFIAFLIPNLFRKLFGEGALSAAFIPVVSEYRETRTLADTSKLVSRVTTLLTLVLAVLTLLSIAFIYVVPGSVLGFNEPEKWAAFQRYYTLLAPMVVFLCVAGAHGGVLNALGGFGLPSLLPALHNVIWIGAIIVGVMLVDDLHQRIQIMCVGVLLGSIVQWAMQRAALARKGLKLRPELNISDPALRQIGRAFGPTVLALAVFQINTLLDLVLAEWLVEGHGAVSAYSYANRLFQFPLGIVGIALGTAIFPMLSRYAARGEIIKVTGGLLNGLRLLGFIVFPAAAGLIALNDEIVRVAFQRGVFTAEDAQRTSRVLIYFSLALPIVAALQLLTKAFYALKDTKTPTKVAFASVAVNIVCNVILVQTSMKEAGLAAATSISSLFNLVVLGTLLARRLRGTIVESRRLRQALEVSDRLAQPLSPSGLRRFGLSLLRSLVFSTLMAGAVVSAVKLVPVQGGGVTDALLLISAVVLGIVLYFGMHRLAASPEFRELRKS